ncbi:MIOREX complex component 2 [Diutina catenulata]
MSVKRSIAIFGGNGFLGRNLVRVGVERGYDVTAFSRRGQPDSSTARQAWASQVKWEHADIFNPDSYRQQLKGIDTVVHSIGMLFENPEYKQVANSNLGFVSDVQSVLNWVTRKGANPMEKNYYHTYEAVQRDSAGLLADAVVEANPESTPNFVYVSADSQIPMVPDRYLLTKREAEFELANKPHLGAIILRPGFMYERHVAGKAPTNRDIVKSILNLGYAAKQCIVGDNVSYVNDLVRPPISTETVAQVMYDKIEDSAFPGGTVTLEEMVRKQN